MEVVAEQAAAEESAAVDPGEAAALEVTVVVAAVAVVAVVSAVEPATSAAAFAEPKTYGFE